MGDTNIQHYDQGAMVLSVDGVMEQVNMIQSLMSRAMKSGEHYGVIPGTGNKPSLLKPGAEKLSMMFRLAPSYAGVDAPVEHHGGHIEFRLVCTLTNIRSGEVWGQGVGSCSTMESKYRYRWDSTGRPVPQDYWQSKDKSILGGEQFTARKSGGTWVIYQRVEHDNPADYYNTVLKMAKKRAMVDAVLTCTAASDIFTQDVEEMAENTAAGSGQPPIAPTKADPPATPTTDRPAAPKAPANQDDGGDVFDTLENELYDFCQGDTMAMAEKLQELTAFPGKDKETGKPTGKMVQGKRSVSELREKGKNAWAGSALKKLREQAGRA